MSNIIVRDLVFSGFFFFKERCLCSNEILIRSPIFWKSRKTEENTRAFLVGTAGNWRTALAPSFLLSSCVRAKPLSSHPKHLCGSLRVLRSEGVKTLHWTTTAGEDSPQSPCTSHILRAEAPVAFVADYLFV